MKPRSLLVLALVVVALGLYIGLWERHQPTTDEARTLADKLFPSMEAQDVRAFDISGPKGDFSFNRDEEKWEISSPIVADADQGAVGSLIRSMLGVKITRKLKEGDVDPADYGLDDPEYRVTLKGKDSPEQHLEIGAKAPLGSERALRLNGGPIVLAKTFFSSDLEKDLKAWRSHELVSVGLYDLAALEIKEPDTKLEMLKIGGKWRLKSPVDDLADEDHLNKLVEGLNSSRILDFVDAAPDLKAMGLDHPRYSVVLTPSNGGAAIRLDYGLKREVDGKPEIACRRGMKDYFWVNNSAENALGKAPVLWREARIAPFQSWDAQSLEIQADGQKFSAQRKEGVWKLESGNDADASKIESRLSTIAKIRATNFDLLKTGQPPIGEISIGLKAPGAEKPEELHISLWKAIEKGGDVLVKVSGRDKLMSIAAADAEKILGGLEDLAQPEPTPGPQEGDAVTTPNPE